MPYDTQHRFGLRDGRTSFLCPTAVSKNMKLPARSPRAFLLGVLKTFVSVGTIATEEANQQARQLVSCESADVVGVGMGQRERRPPRHFRPTVSDQPRPGRRHASDHHSGAILSDVYRWLWKDYSINT